MQERVLFLNVRNLNGIQRRKFKIKPKENSFRHYITKKLTNSQNQGIAEHIFEKVIKTVTFYCPKISSPAT